MNRIFRSVVCLCAVLAVAEDAPVVNTVRPTPSATQAVFTVPARTEAAEEAYLAARVTGTLAERRADLGDRVAAGAVLALISAPEIGHDLARARARLVEAEARQRLAEARLERARPLAAEGQVTAEDLDQRSAEAAASAAAAAAARADLARLEQDQEFLQLRAPFAGTVAGRRSDRGDRVIGDPTGEGAWLYHLVRLDELRLIVDAPPALALRLRSGDVADVRFPEMPGQRFSARVARISPVVDRGNGTQRIELLLPNPGERLPAGLSGSASLRLAREGVVLVPVNAVVLRDGRSSVARISEGRLRYQPVQTGRNLGRSIEILDGLGSQDDIAVSPNALLRDGDPVTPRPVASPSASAAPAR